MPKLRHIASPPYAAWTYGTKFGENCVTLRHRLMPLGLTANRPADPLFQAGTDGVTQAWRQVRVSIAASGPVRPRPLAVGITANGRKDQGSKSHWGTDRGREGWFRAPPPSEPDRRISRIRLSSWWFTS